MCAQAALGVRLSRGPGLGDPSAVISLQCVADRPVRTQAVPVEQMV